MMMSTAKQEDKRQVKVKRERFDGAKGEVQCEMGGATRRSELEGREMPVVLPCLERTNTYGTFLSSQSSGR